jgi:hypothetical protein
MAAVTTLPAAFVSGNVLTAAQLNDVRGAFRVLQVVQATFATSTASTSTSFVTSGLNASITPSSNTSKVLVLVTVPVRTENTSGGVVCTIFRGTVAGTNLLTADGFGRLFGSSDMQGVMAMNFLDSPATTSATTYTLGFKSTAGQNTACQINNATSSITLMEISA